MSDFLLLLNNMWFWHVLGLVSSIWLHFTYEDKAVDEHILQEVKPKCAGINPEVPEVVVSRAELRQTSIALLHELTTIPFVAKILWNASSRQFVFEMSSNEHFKSSPKNPYIG